MNLTLSLPAPGKINRMLHILGKRSDGYHQLQTLFQFIDLADQLYFTPTATSGIEVDCPDLDLAMEDNLVYRAAKHLHQFMPDQGVQIRIEKRLPLGGGLGGGSSNAATTLIALNQLWHLDLSLDTLAKIGLNLGADVPVFIRGQAAWAEGVGERLLPVTLEQQPCVILHPGCHCSTGALFQDPRLPRQTPPISVDEALHLTGSNNFTALALTLYPALNACFDWVKQQGHTPCLSGSGACVFVLCENLTQAELLVQNFPDQLAGAATQAWITQTQNLSPCHALLSQPL